MEVNFKINFKSIALSVIIILISLELSPYIIASAILEEGFSRKKIKSELSKITIADTSNTKGEENTESYLSEHIVHPYLGFIHSPDKQYNQFGFPSEMPLLSKAENEINVCIMGGSVAKQLYQVSGNDLLIKLKHHPDFANKKINLVCVSLGGFKQPQQLLAMNYLLSLGAVYDYVINLDGFNEVVLPYSDNLPFGIHPSFPRHWNIYSRKILDKNVIQLLGKQALHKQQQQQRAEKFSNSVFSNSNFALFIWKVFDRESEIEILESERILRDEISNAALTPQTSGPKYPFTDTLDFFKYQVNYWAQCSQQMNGLAQNFEVNYLHFLQPNQYYANSKKLTKEELSIAYEQGDFAYKEAVEMAYPLLVKKGELLIEKGIQFRDLTQLFAEEPSTVYIDKCCHFNKKGYDAIADQIVSAMTSYPE